MARPIKCRQVEQFPSYHEFTPDGMLQDSKAVVTLKIEELEAMRLKDIEGLSQEACAAKMVVSRQTFQNILTSARKKVTMALLNGYSLTIGGGEFTTDYCKFKCFTCGKTYLLTYAQDKKQCPKCQSKSVRCIENSKSCQKWCK